MTYKKRYNDTQRQNAYMNACDCIYYGYWRTYWNNCGLDNEESVKVWEQAVKDIGNSGFMEG